MFSQALSFLNPLKGGLLKVLSIALAGSLAVNALTIMIAKHEYDSKQKIITVQKVLYQEQVKQVKVVEHADQKVAESVQKNTSSRIASDLAALRLYNSSSGTLPSAPESPSSITSATNEAQLLPNELVLKDKESCVIDYDLVVGWQKWYNDIQNVGGVNELKPSGN